MKIILQGRASRLKNTTHELKVKYLKKKNSSKAIKKYKQINKSTCHTCEPLTCGNKLLV